MSLHEIAPYLSTLNACLNALCFVVLVFGYRSIKSKDKEAHKKFMLSAMIISIVFLCSYLVYHYEVGSVAFQGKGVIRVIYLGILISHIIMVIFQVPLVVSAFYTALNEKWSTHRRIVKYAFPSWIYVSVTGVIVYLILYHYPI